MSPLPPGVRRDRDGDLVPDLEAGVAAATPRPTTTYQPPSPEESARNLRGVALVKQSLQEARPTTKENHHAHRAQA